jgi:hypothetical protein
MSIGGTGRWGIFSLGIFLVYCVVLGSNLDSKVFSDFSLRIWAVWDVVRASRKDMVLTSSAHRNRLVPQYLRG